MKHFSTTNYTNYTNWLRHSSCLRIVMLLALFTLHCSLFISLVRAQDAFYIYRNDGDFNGFFFDEVVRMGYSKFDLDSVEHDIYVVQEVETTDSLYRIPLAAIDSIGFQQPEIILNPRIKNMDETGLSDYILEAHDAGMYLSLDTPEELLPKSGDVLISYDNPIFNLSNREDYSGFARKASTGAIKKQDHYVVYYSLLQGLQDVFVQFITVENVVEDEQGNVRRRLAGWDAEKHQPHKESGSASLSLIDIDRTLKHDFEIGKGKLGVELGIAMKVKLVALYQITASQLFIRVKTAEDFSLKASAAGKYDGEIEGQILGLPQKLSSIKFPAAAPFMQTRPIPYSFLRVKGEMGARIDLPAVGFSAVQTLTIDGDKVPLMSFSHFETGPGGKPQKGFLEGTDVSFYFNGSVQIGAKFSANIETNDWFEDIFKTGIACDIYLGPQVEGKIELKSSLADIVSGNANIYQAMYDSNISMAGLAANLEVKGECSFLGDTDKQTFMEFNKKWLEAKWYLLPDLSKSEVHFDKGNGTVKGITKATRAVFVPSYLGMGIYRKSGNTADPDILLDKKFSNHSYFLTEKNNNTAEFTFDKKLPLGAYYARPMVSLLGADVPAPSIGSFVVTPYICHGTDTIMETEQVGAANEQCEILFRTNAKDVNIYLMDKDGKRTKPTWQYEVDEYDEENDIRALTVKMGKNEAPLPREWKILLCATAKLDKNSYEACDTVLLQQPPGNTSFKLVQIYINGRFKGKSETQGYDSETGNFSRTEDYDYRTGAFGSGNVKCDISGNIIHCTVSDVSEEAKGSIGDQNANVKKSVTSFEFTIDVSSPDKPYIMNGWIRDDYRVYESKYNESLWGSTMKKDYMQADTEYLTQINWSGPILLSSSANGVLTFRQEGIQNVTGSYTSRTDYTYYNSFAIPAKESHYVSTLNTTYVSPPEGGDITIRISY